MIYIIKMFHMKEKNTESFEYCAYDPERNGKWVGSHHTEELPRNDNSTEPMFQDVMEKRVYGETPYNAICRFIVWQNKGYPDSWLLEDTK